MNYVLLDCDYTEREDYRLNKEVTEEEVRERENTSHFVNKLKEALDKVEEYEHITEIVFEPFVEKKGALELIYEAGDKEKISLLEGIVYATCLIEGDSCVIDRGLEVVAADIVSLDLLYTELESNGYVLPRVSTEDIRNDILTGSMLKRENILTKGRSK